MVAFLLFVLLALDMGIPLLTFSDIQWSDRQLVVALSIIATLLQYVLPCLPGCTQVASVPSNTSTSARHQLVGGVIGDTSLGETLLAQQAGVAMAAGETCGRWVVAGECLAVVHAQRQPALDDLGLGQCDQRSVDREALAALDASSGRQVGHALVGFDIFGPAVGV